ncbi:hypothetical protein KIK06_25565 [Nocardiopsis sp. EMB25]|uniref:hypothetical protein n=1 Tax=Nocardiopsis sp. EMB25 TaxID=2835867 RepID=UPI0022836081|nr:hypothetical protein [Nocardiopsis sp. EMB25]MCY9787254.1 hypothetical protein [Nocardiopsis sp. EMB25]
MAARISAFSATGFAILSIAFTIPFSGQSTEAPAVYTNAADDSGWQSDDSGWQ